MDIFLDQPVNTSTLQKILEAFFPDLTFFEDDFTEENKAPVGFNSENRNHIIFNTSFDDQKKEFGFQICIYRMSEHDIEDTSLVIAEAIAKQFGVRAIVPFTHPEHSLYPYYSILFEKGKTYLVDDSDTNWADGTENRIKILEEYNPNRGKSGSKQRWKL